MYIYPIKNLIKRLELISSYCRDEHLHSMSITINKTVKILLEMFNLLNKDNQSHDIT